MFPYLLSGPLYTRSGTSSTEARIIAEDTVKATELKLEALELTCAAMWTILKDKLGVTDEQLIEAIHEVDARDGVVDGRITPSARVCPHCKRKVLTRNPTKCAWCGGELGPLGT